MSNFIDKVNKIFPTPKFLRMPTFGLDISDDSLKFMYLLPGKKGVEVEKYGEIKIPTGIIELGKIKDAVKLEKIILNFKKKYDIKDVRVSILENQVYLFRVRLQKENLVNIRQGIEFVLEEHIPIPAINTIFDYEIAEENDYELIVQVAAIQIDIINEYLSVFEICDINVHSFEIEAQAISRAIFKKEDKETYMIIDIGKKRTMIFIVSRGLVVFTSTIDFGGDVFNQMIIDHLNVGSQEAEEIKRRYGLQRNIDDKDVFPIILNGASILRDEILKHFFYWHSHEDEDGRKNPKIKKILLCGGVSSMVGLAEYFSVTMKISVEIANVWTNVLDLKKHIPQIGSKEALSFSTSIGLALKDFEND